MSHGSRISVVPLAALVALLAAAPGASAFSLTGVDAATQDPPLAGANAGPLPASGKDAAGAHPNFGLQLDFSDDGNGSADSVKTYDLHLAPGIVSYVNHVERCTRAQFAQQDLSSASSCPAGSLVGSVVTDVTIRALALDVPVSLSGGRIYNLEPPPGFPAALGIDIPPPAAVPGLPLLERTKLLATVTIDPHDLALTARLHDLPNTASGLPVHIDRITQTLFGYVDGNSFFTNPTSCISAPISVTATSHAGAVSTNGDAYTPSDCAGVPFGTTLAIAADPPTTDSTSTISFNVQPGAHDVPRANSHVRSTVVTAPPGVLINPALAARLDACTDAQFAQSDTSVPATCLPSSAVGDINFVSPILGAFPGKAYFGTQTPTDRLRLFLDVPLYGAHIKVSAHVHPSYETGQITTVFDELPQIAFTDFTLTFNGGPRSALVTPTICGTHTATALTTPWSGTAPSTSSGSFSISFDGRGAACERIFQPSMATAVSDTRAGASPTFTLVARRPDRHVPIGRMTYMLPAGLVGNLALDGLTECALSAAAAAQCPASSRIGSVTALAGSGTEPPSLPGSVYLTKPKAPGDPAGLSVQVPAQLGPVDAGIVIVGARLQLRSDGGLLVTSDPIPALQLGIPLALRELTVRIDRPGLMRNPSGCGSKVATGHFDALGGGSADASSALTFTACERLGFAPRIRAFIGARGRNRVGSHPPFVTSISAGAVDAAIRRAYVRLPKALATNVLALDAACTQTSFDAGTCSKRARVATARAVSPLFEEPVTGPVYLVKRDRGLPKLTIALRDPIAIQFDGIVTVGKGGRIATTFAAVPDLPVTKFVLRFHGGRYGALATNRNLCRTALRLPAKFAGHNGKTAQQRPRMTVRGCPKH
jgi:hypothetical protein